MLGEGKKGRENWSRHVQEPQRDEKNSIIQLNIFHLIKDNKSEQTEIARCATYL